MSYKLSNRSLERLQDVKSILIAIIVESISHPDCPFDFGVPRHGGKRTASEQNLLFNQTPKVTYKDGYNKKSYHQTGRAFDIYAFVGGKASWKREHLEPIARHIQRIAKERYNITLKWGGDWKKFKDLPHFQI